MERKEAVVRLGKKWEKIPGGSFCKHHGTRGIYVRGVCMVRACFSYLCFREGGREPYFPGVVCGGSGVFAVHTRNDIPRSYK